MERGGGKMRGKGEGKERERKGGGKEGGKPILPVDDPMSYTRPLSGM